MIPYCESPRQSLLAALVGGLLGTVFAGLLGLGVPETLVLAGGLGGLGDLGAHFLRRDPQFEAALAQLGGGG